MNERTAAKQSKEECAHFPLKTAASCSLPSSLHFHFLSIFPSRPPPFNRSGNHGGDGARK